MFRRFDPVVLKGVLGMYFYSYLWMRSDGALSPDVVAGRLNDLALRMLAKDAATTTRDGRASKAGAAKTRARRPR